MIWSIIPEEIVFENWDQPYTIQEKTINNRVVKVRVGTDGYGNIERIMSSNPKDFLDNSLNPGRKIRI